MGLAVEHANIQITMRGYRCNISQPQDGKGEIVTPWTQIVIVQRRVYEDCVYGPRTSESPDQRSRGALVSLVSHGRHAAYRPSSRGGGEPNHLTYKRTKVEHKITPIPQRNLTNLTFEGLNVAKAFPIRSLTMHLRRRARVSKIKEIAFSTFLKLLELDQKARRAEFRRLNAGGGYPYWQPLKDAATNAIKVGADVNALIKEVEKKCSGHQQKHNKNALVTLCGWSQTRECTPIEQPSALTIPFGTSGISIRLHPDISFKLNGITYSMLLWATTKPPLSDETLSVALLFTRSEYEHHGVGHRFVIFDTIKKKVFTEMDIIASANKLLQAKKDLFKKDWEAATSAPPPPSSPSGVHPNPVGP
jgi:hypothetical protein